MPEQEAIPFEKSTLIRDLKVGDRIIALFALRKKQIAPYQSGAKMRLVLEFGDSSGRIQGVLWDGAEQIEPELTEGGVVRVEGTIGEYREKPQITVDKIRMALRGEYSPEVFLPVGPVEPDEALTMWRDIASTVSDEHLRALFGVLLSDESFVSRFRLCPAAKLWHHPYVGGLAYHSACVAKLCERACELHTELDRDLLVAGALLHDVGKVEELELTTFVDYSIEGRLHGHVYIGARMVERAIERVDGFPDETRLRLVHLILSHQGAGELGAVVKPMTREAIVLHHADQMDAQYAGSDRVLKKNEGSDGAFTEYVKLIERHLYKGMDGQESDPTR
jgi:3'-5' exoribonuclease